MGCVLCVSFDDKIFVPLCKGLFLNKLRKKTDGESANPGSPGKGHHKGCSLHIAVILLKFISDACYTVYGNAYI